VRSKKHEQEIVYQINAPKTDQKSHIVNPCSEIKGVCAIGINDPPGIAIAITIGIKYSHGSTPLDNMFININLETVQNILRGDHG